MSLPSNSQPSAFCSFAEKIVFSSRPLVIAIFAFITVLMLICASALNVDAGFKKQIPREHEYMKTFEQYEEGFGGANRVLVAVFAEDGNIFSDEYMSTLEKVSNDVMSLDSTDDARMRSLFTPNVRFVEVVEDGFAGGNVIPNTYSPSSGTGSPEQFSTIRSNIVKANIVGRLVAKDYSGTMIWADLIPEGKTSEKDGPKTTEIVSDIWGNFLEEVSFGKIKHVRPVDTKNNYPKIAEDFEGLRKKYETGNIKIRIIGFAKVVGDITDGAKSVGWFFIVTIAFTWLLLFIYSSSIKLASLTVFVAMVSVVWMLGALKLLGYGIDPMNMLTPFLIFAIAVSHGEQMINRFRGEIFFGGLEEGTVAELRERAKNAHPPLEAARNSFRALLIPGTVALVAGCIGFAAIMVIDIQMIRELAVTATIGVAFTILTDLVLLPVLLSYTKLRNMDNKRAYRLRQLTQFDKIWAFLSKFSKPKPAAIIIVLGAVIWFFAWMQGNKVLIGDAEQGVAELRPPTQSKFMKTFGIPASRYNQDAVAISKEFGLGVDILNVIVEAGPSACTSSYKAMETIDRLAWHLNNVPGVEQVMTLPIAAKIANAGWNEGSIKWRTLPRDSDTLRQATQSFDTDSGLLDSDCRTMPVMVFAADHKATTIDRIVKEVKVFRTENKLYVEGFDKKRDAAEAAATEKGETYSTDDINIRLGTGSLGVAAAINDTVRESEHWILGLLYAAVFLMCWISFKSPRAALCVMLPLVIVTELGHSLMTFLDIGMKVNTLTVVALGVGIGVDYGIYIFARMREAMMQGHTLSESYFIALKTTGIAISYTALTLAVGVAMWMFSDLKFQADMGIMLTFMFIVNMIAAIIFLPALCRWLLRPTEKDDWKPVL